MIFGLFPADSMRVGRAISVGIVKNGSNRPMSETTCHYKVGRYSSNVIQ
jgi:hypothetical protein